MNYSAALEYLDAHAVYEKTGVIDAPSLVIVGHINFAGAAYVMKRMTRSTYWVIAYGLEAWGALSPLQQRVLRAHRATEHGHL